MRIIKSLDYVVIVYIMHGRAEVFGKQIIRVHMIEVGPIQHIAVSCNIQLAEHKLYEPIKLLCNSIGWHKVTLTVVRMLQPAAECKLYEPILHSDHYTVSWTACRQTNRRLRFMLALGDKLPHINHTQVP